MCRALKYCVTIIESSVITLNKMTTSDVAKANHTFDVKRFTIWFIVFQLPLYIDPFNQNPLLRVDAIQIWRSWSSWEKADSFMLCE